MSTAKQLNLFDVDPPISPIAAVWNGQTLYRSGTARLSVGSFAGSPIVTVDFATFQPMIEPIKDKPQGKEQARYIDTSWQADTPVGWNADSWIVNCTYSDPIVGQLVKIAGVTQRGLVLSYRLVSGERWYQVHYRVGSHIMTDGGKSQILRWCDECD